MLKHSRIRRTALLPLAAALVLSAAGSAHAAEFGTSEKWTADPYYGTHGTHFADVTGDRKADAIVVNDDRVWVRRAQGSYFGSNEPWTDRRFVGSLATQFADVTGDGQADAIAVNSNGILVRPSGGYPGNAITFLPSETWSSVPFFGSLGTYFADVNGDRRADAIVVNENGIVVRPSTGSGFATRQEPWTNGVAYYGTHGTYFADVTGDRLADAIVVNDDRVVVRRSNGIRFTPNEPWTADRYVGTQGNQFADVNGDGQADALAVNDWGILARRSAAAPGITFLGNEVWSSDPFFGSRGTYFSDVNGDARADAIAVNENGVTVRKAKA